MICLAASTCHAILLEPPKSCGFLYLQVVLKEGATPRDMLRAMMHAIYLNHLEGTGITSLEQDSGKGHCVLRVSHDFMARQFEQIKQDIGAAGWICEGLIARPAPNRLLESPVQTVVAS